MNKIQNLDTIKQTESQQETRHMWPCTRKPSLCRKFCNMSLRFR